MKSSTQILGSLVAALAILSQSAIATYVYAASSKTKTIVMENDKTYHCHAKGSERLQKGQSNFRCELMKQDNINNPYDYITTNEVINLSCSGKLTETIEYDEGTVYKFLMTCRKPVAKTISATVRQSQCSTVLEDIKSSLTNITKFEISKLSKHDGIPPQGKTQHLTIISSGIQGAVSLPMATKIIKSSLAVLRLGVFGL